MGSRSGAYTFVVCGFRRCLKPAATWNSRSAIRLRTAANRAARLLRRRFGGVCNEWAGSPFEEPAQEQSDEHAREEHTDYRQRLYAHHIICEKHTRSTASSILFDPEDYAVAVNVSGARSFRRKGTLRSFDHVGEGALMRVVEPPV